MLFAFIFASAQQNGGARWVCYIDVAAKYVNEKEVVRVVFAVSPYLQVERSVDYRESGLQTN